jgi:hypothetical protein
METWKSDDDLEDDLGGCVSRVTWDGQLQNGRSAHLNDAVVASSAAAPQNLSSRPAADSCARKHALLRVIHGALQQPALIWLPSKQRRGQVRTSAGKSEA